MALKTRKNKQAPLIHHSDTGLQYCANNYQKLLNDNNILLSMTEQYDPYENAIAEGVNGILKQEFDIDKFDANLKNKTDLVKNVIKIFNQIRPHVFNYMLTPNQMHAQNKFKRKKAAI